jgi:hypothetical protein
MQHTKMSSMAQIYVLHSHYPFQEEEIEILLRCHASITKYKDDEFDSFLNKLAHSSPYTYFFLPDDEMRRRTTMIEKFVLPPHFGPTLKSLVFNEDAKSEEESIEYFIHAISDCCRRGPREVSALMYDCAKSDMSTNIHARDIVMFCYRLFLASKILIAPSVSQEDAMDGLLDHIASHEESDALQDAIDSLSTVADSEGLITKNAFVSWALSTNSIILCPFSSLVNNLIFHGKSPHTVQEGVLVSTNVSDASGVFDPASSFLKTNSIAG